MKLRNIRMLAAAVLLSSVAACSGDSPTGGSTTGSTHNIDIQNVFASSSSPASGSASRVAKLVQLVEIRRIRVTVYEVPSAKVLFQKEYDVDPNQTHWILPFEAPNGATVKIVSELMSVTGGTTKVEYSGQSAPVTITPCPTTCTPVPVQTYPGPIDNLGATSASITPHSASVVAGATVALTGTAAPAGPAYQGVWSTLDAGIATVNAAGLVTGVNAGTARIVYAVAALRDTATITVTPANTCVTAAYTLGASVNGAWTAGDCVATGATARHYDMYEFTITQQTAFRAQVDGAAGRRISLRRSGTQSYVETMPDIPANTNPLQLGYILPAGSYVFEIATPDAATLGNYTFSSSLNSAVTCDPIIFTTFGVTVNEQLTSTDCPDGGGGVEDRFVILPDSGKRVNLTLSTTAFAPVVAFRDDRLGPASPLLTLDVRNTVGQTARTSYTTTFGGFHEIIVNNATSAVGAYTLTIAEGNATNTCGATPTSIGGQTTAFFESSDCKVGTQVYDSYSFTLTGQGVVQATEVSSLNPKILGVFTSTGTEVLEWLGGASDFTANWYLAPGQYEIRATAPATAARTSYTLKTLNGPASIGCATNSTTGNITLTAQSLATTDCTFNSRYEDRLTLLVPAGKDIVVDMTATGFIPAAIVRDPASQAGTVLTRVTRTDAGSVTATWHTTVAGYYQVIFSSDLANATGSYSGAVTIR